MMTEVIFYGLESAVCVAVFTLFYYMVLRKETFFSLNRLFLLFAMIYAMVVPLLDIHYGFNSSGSAEVGTFLNTTVSNIESLKQGVIHLDPLVVNSGESAWSLSLAQILAGIYFAGTGIFLLTFGVRFYRLYSTIRLSEKSSDGEYHYLKVSDHPDRVYSFFNYIFINKNKLDIKDFTPIIEHEKSHAALYHSIDLIILEILTVLQWFNPFIYLLRKMVVENHEFQADSSVVRSSGNKAGYLQLILDHVINSHYFRMTSAFSYSLSKKRLKMLTRMKSSHHILKIKVLAVLPIAVLLFLFFACSEKTGEQGASPAEKEPVALSQIKQEKVGEKVPASVVNEYEQEIEQNGGEHMLGEFYAEFEEDEYAQGTIVLRKYVTYGIYLYNYGEGKSYAYLEMTDTTGDVVSTTKNTSQHRLKKQHFYFDNQVDTQPVQIKVKDSKNRANKVVVVLTEATSLSSSKGEQEDNIYLKPDEMPRYKGDKKLAAFRAELMNNIKYPEKAKKEKIDGMVYIDFVVNEEGKIEDKKIVNGADPLLNKAALEAFEGMSDWTPGKVDGKPVKTKFTIPVVFRLN